MFIVSPLSREISIFKEDIYILISIHCEVDALKNNMLKMDDEETNINSSLCLIFEKDEETDALQECSSGIPKLIEYGALFGLTLLISYLDTKQNEGLYIFKYMQLLRRILEILFEKEEQEKHQKVARIATRLSIEGFNWKEQCFFCGKHPGRRPIHQVTFLHYRETILKSYNSRNEDPWNLKVKRRIINCIDLVQEEARHHDYCHIKFTSGKPHRNKKEDHKIISNNVILKSC